ncbi:MAG: TDP-4-oxo-6-deoxy-alpha-D-glucose-3,4-oxoisomerase [Anaerolineae bacterium]|nr:TDP-4-oxo-6-deoxy-alpha-D-glucose-3,4-oxoisomerase [Anaerolineae bacterium]
MRSEGHAYMQLQEFIVALSGSFDVVLDDGYNQKTYVLNRSYFGLYIPNLIWRQIQNFSTNAFCMIAASLPFAEDDYIRDYRNYLETRNTHTK